VGRELAAPPRPPPSAVSPAKACPLSGVEGERPPPAAHRGPIVGGAGDAPHACTVAIRHQHWQPGPDP
jgi:hypothetical protein